MINIVISNLLPISPLKKTDIETVVKEAILKLGLTGDMEIEIIFVDKEEIKNLNGKYRQKVKETDVLSFPQQKTPAPKNVLGSIVICLDVVQEKEENLVDVIKHGLLHLAGYDHETNEKEWVAASKKIDCKL